jgi:hypothetical protein
MLVILIRSVVINFYLVILSQSQHSISCCCCVTKIAQHLCLYDAMNAEHINYRSLPFVGLGCMGVVLGCYVRIVSVLNW